MLTTTKAQVGGGHERGERRVHLFGVICRSKEERESSRKGKKRKRTGQQAAPEKEPSNPIKHSRYRQAAVYAETQVQDSRTKPGRCKGEQRGIKRTKRAHSRLPHSKSQIIRRIILRIRRQLELGVRLEFVSVHQVF
jgi:hypothetical protein